MAKETSFTEAARAYLVAKKTLEEAQNDYERAQQAINRAEPQLEKASLALASSQHLQTMRRRCVVIADQLVMIEEDGGGTIKIFCEPVEKAL